LEAHNRRKILLEVTIWIHFNAQADIKKTFEQKKTDFCFLFSLKSFQVIFFCFFLASHRLKVASKSRLKSQWTKHLQTFLHKNIKNKCPYKLKVLIIDVAIKSGPIFSMVEPKTWPEKVGEIFCYFEVLKKYENSSNSFN
jgi:hypothetical protein